MKITKSNNVLIETTNTVNGMLEQGGVCGRVVSYPLSGVMRATGLTRDEIEAADEDDDAPSHDGLTISQACEYEVTGRVIRKGVEIE